jgi:hypothetical protein
VLPRVSLPRTSPPCRDGLQHRHVSHGPGPHLPTEVASSAATCSVVPYLASLPRWAPVLTPVPWPRDSPRCRGGLRHCHVSHGLDLTSLQRWALVLSCVTQPRTSPPCRGGLRRCHMSCGLGPRLLVQVGSDAATCPVAWDLTSLPRWALALPRGPRPQDSPPCQGGLQSCHVSRSPGPHLPKEVGSGAAMCRAASDLASLPR